MKDTLYLILKEILVENSVNCQRFALADDLKLELNQFTTSNYDISAFTKNSKEKEIIRPLMVIHGKIKRDITHGKYWTGLLQPKIEESLKNNELPVITDVRYCKYSEDEVYWAKEVNKAILVHITRYDKNNIKIAPANLDEAENEPKLISAANFKLTWPTSDDRNLLKEIVKTQLSELINNICQK